MSDTVAYETLHQCILCDSAEITSFDGELCLSKCRQCGLVFDNPRPAFDSIARYYSQEGKYDDRLPIEGGIDRHCQGLVKRLRRYKPTGNLLDVGAGTGQFLQWAKDHYLVEGTEISEEAIAFAQRKYGISLRKGEVEDIDFEDRTFDVLTMFQVLEHVPSPRRTLLHCRRLLKDDGLLFIVVPNEAPYSLRLLLPRLFGMLGVARFKPFVRRGLRKIDLESMWEVHLSHFSEPALRHGLERCGYDVVGSGVEFHDAFMFSKGLPQVSRHILYGLAVVLKRLTGLNIYNCMWVAARPSRR